MPELLLVRRIGAVLLACAAVFVWFAMAPEEPTTFDSEGALSLIQAEDDANNELTDGAPQQTVVNGWTANQLLELLVRQNSTAPTPADDRPAALLALGVLGIALIGATGGPPGPTPRAAVAWAPVAVPPDAAAGPQSAWSVTYAAQAADGSDARATAPVGSAEPVYQPADSQPGQPGGHAVRRKPVGQRLVAATGKGAAWVRGHVLAATLVGLLVVGGILVALTASGLQARQEAGVATSVDDTCQQLADTLKYRPTNEDSANLLNSYESDVVTGMETECAKNLEILRSYADAAGPSS